MSRNMTGRYTWAGMLFNGLKLESAEAVESEGPGAPAARSLPAPARMELKHYLDAGRIASGRLPGPLPLSGVAERLKAHRRRRLSRRRPVLREIVSELILRTVS